MSGTPNTSDTAAGETPPSETFQRKQEIRKAAHENRRNQPDKDDVSRVIVNRFMDLPEYSAANTVMFYVDVRDEVRTRHALPEAIEGDKRIIIPYCVDGELELFHLESMDELVGLCSGRFKTQKPTQIEEEDEDDDTQILTENQCSADTVILTENQDEEEQAPGFMEDNVGSTLPYESDEDEDEIERKKNKAKKPLVLSDEEEEEEEKNVVKSFQGFLGKKGGLRKEFVENEAELSGEEPDSGDEDERGLDRLDEEDGDLEEFDVEDVRDEVGKIHQKRILDEDKRDVRLFQEAFLEDGELHTDRARTRQFRWQGIDDGAELDKRTSDGEEEEEVSDAEEEKRRIAKLEREKWIQESSSTVQNEEDNSQFFNLASKAMKKIEGKKKENNKVPFQQVPINKSITSSIQRGSFLSRDEKILDRLAEMTKGTENQKTGSGAKNTNNFVFAALSPGKQAKGEVPNERKRGAKTTNNKIPMKKAKINRTIDENSRDTIFGFM